MMVVVTTTTTTTMMVVVVVVVVTTTMMMMTMTTTMTKTKTRSRSHCHAGSDGLAGRLTFSHEHPVHAAVAVRVVALRGLQVAGLTAGVCRRALHTRDASA